MTLHVTHDDAEAVHRQRDHVVPVTADLASAPGRVIAHGDLAALDLLDPPRQHGRLEAGGELALLVEERRPLEGLGHDGGQAQTQIALIGVEGRAFAVEERQGAEGTRLGDERQIGGRAEFQPLRAGSQHGIAVDELRDRGDEPGTAAENRVGQGVPPVQPRGPEFVDRLQRVTAQSDDVERRVLDQTEREPVRAEPGQPARSGERGGHIVHRHRPRQRTRCSFNNAGLALPPFFQVQHEGRMGDLRRRVPYHPDDPVRPAVVAAQYPRLDVGPLGRAVVERYPDVHTVRGAPALDRFVDRHVESGPLRGIPGAPPGSWVVSRRSSGPARRPAGPLRRCPASGRPGPTRSCPSGSWQAAAPSRSRWCVTSRSAGGAGRLCSVAGRDRSFLLRSPSGGGQPGRRGPYGLSQLSNRFRQAATADTR